MGCCCHQKNYLLQTDLLIQSPPHSAKIALSPTSQLNSSKQEEPQNPKNEQLTGGAKAEPAEQQLRQSPIFGENCQQLWQQLMGQSEQMQQDFLRVTHTNNMPISIENSMRKRAQNMVISNQLHSSTAETNLLPLVSRKAASNPTPHNNLQALSTIKEEDSSLYDTNRKSANQISVSDCSQRAGADLRKLF